jgi:cytochrome b involved in lipid metabolism
MNLPWLLLFLSSWHVSKAFVPHPSLARAPSLSQSRRSKSAVVLFYRNITNPSTDLPLDRFQRQASQTHHVQEPCIISIHGNRHNLTAWANAHPGGFKVLEKFHNRDASRAFEAVHHSAAAYGMLKDFLIEEESTVQAINATATIHKPLALSAMMRRKLFTKEDPSGVHKYLGIFCLLNFIGRYRQMYFGDPAAGLGTHGHPWFAMACLLPHALLSLSSLIFHTVPRERVAKAPMIWKEFRVHNIIFGVRSVLTAFAASLAIRAGNTPMARRWAVAASCACVLMANVAADMSTHKLRAVQEESTTATMPYWEGCSIKTQKRFKSFYAYCQFMATLACLVRTRRKAVSMF